MGIWSVSEAAQQARSAPDIRCRPTHLKQRSLTALGARPYHACTFRSPNSAPILADALVSDQQLRVHIFAVCSMARSEPGTRVSTRAPSEARRGRSGISVHCAGAGSIAVFVYGRRQTRESAQCAGRTRPQAHGSGPAVSRQSRSQARACCLRARTHSLPSGCRFERPPARPARARAVRLPWCE